MIFIPELNCWINKLYFESEINEISTNYPSYLNISDWDSNTSIFNLLFNECTTQKSYEYQFKKIMFSGISSDMLRTRLSTIAPNEPIYVIPDLKFDKIYSDSTTLYNVLEINEEEIGMLDLLLQFRVTGVGFDSTTIDYSSLESSFSKLIYHYIELVSTGSTEYDLTKTLSNSNRLLEVCFERYFIETYFRIKDKQIMVLDSTFDYAPYELNPAYEIYELDSSSIMNSEVKLRNVPFVEDSENLTLIYNGIKRYPERDYILILRNNECWLNWNGFPLEEELDCSCRIFVNYSYF